MSLRPIATESITVDATAGGVGLTTTTITRNVLLAIITVEAAQIRYNSVNPPTAAGTEGSPTADPGDTLELWGMPTILGFRAIRSGGVSATIRVQYFGTGD